MVRKLNFHQVWICSTVNVHYLLTYSGSFSNSIYYLQVLFVLLHLASSLKLSSPWSQTIVFDYSFLLLQKQHKDQLILRFCFPDQYSSTNSRLFFGWTVFDLSSILAQTEAWDFIQWNSWVCFFRESWCLPLESCWSFRDFCRQISFLATVVRDNLESCFYSSSFSSSLLDSKWYSRCQSSEGCPSSVCEKDLEVICPLEISQAWSPYFLNALPDIQFLKPHLQKTLPRRRNSANCHYWTDSDFCRYWCFVHRSRNSFQIVARTIWCLSAIEDCRSNRLLLSMAPSWAPVIMQQLFWDFFLGFYADGASRSSLATLSSDWSSPFLAKFRPSPFDQLIPSISCTVSFCCLRQPSKFWPPINRHLFF